MPNSQEKRNYFIQSSTKKGGSAVYCESFTEIGWREKMLDTRKDTQAGEWKAAWRLEQIVRVSLRSSRAIQPKTERC
jgi:predicted outer membrane repeat protein